MGKHYTVALEGPIVGTALPAEYPVSFTGNLNHAVPYLNRSASFVFRSQLRCSTSLRTVLLRHQGGHVSQCPDAFAVENLPVHYRVIDNGANKAAYFIFLTKH
jgi:hypothetical protein